MKISHLSLIALTAAAFASCAPFPTSPTGVNNSNNQAGGTQTTPQGEVPAPVVDAANNIPVGRPSPDGKKNMVLSPYAPYNIIDVSGYKSGDIVGDPSTANVDPATGKLNLRTAKHFRLP